VVRRTVRDGGFVFHTFLRTHTFVPPENTKATFDTALRIRAFVTRENTAALFTPLDRGAVPR
jgi:hypothetical protein